MPATFGLLNGDLEADRVPLPLGGARPGRDAIDRSGVPSHLMTSGRGDVSVFVGFCRGEERIVVNPGARGDHESLGYTSPPRGKILKKFQGG